MAKFKTYLENSWWNSHFYFNFKNDKINYKSLTNYQYIVIQLLSNKNYKDSDLIPDESFTITNKNDWYKCDSNDPNCGLEFHCQDIIKNKPVQEVSDCLIYKIYGDATIKKNKYLFFSFFSIFLFLNSGLRLMLNIGRLIFISCARFKIFISTIYLYNKSEDLERCIR